MTAEAISSARRWWGAARVDWREPPALWVTLGWVAAVLWPPLPVTWIIWPATQSSGGQLLDWRVVASVMGGIGVATTFALIQRERQAAGQPRSRFGVFVRFIVWGFLFAVAGALILALLGAVWTAVFATGDAVRRIAEFKASLTLGMAFMPAALVVGVSYSVWAGLAASIISFTPRAPSVRPGHYLIDRLLDPVGAGRAGGPVTAERAPAAPSPPPAQGPQPETELEAALRPDWDHL